MQQGFDDAGHWGPRNNPDCEANIGRLLEHWREQTDRSCSSATTPTEEHSPLRPDQPGNAFKDVVTGEPDVLVSKHTNSCFYGDPDLHAWLQDREIQQLVYLRHHDQPLLRDDRPDGRATSATTCSFVIDATHTFDRGDLTADQLAHATATNLNGEFATSCQRRDVRS